MATDRPFWVRLGLWGVPNRASAWFFFWVTMALAVGFVVYALTDVIYIWGGAFIFASMVYYASIRWMDRHKGW